MTIWKFGCNWGGHENSFYEFIRDEKIVIGRLERVPYEVDDLVLITSGYTVLAIARVKEKPRSIMKSGYRFVEGQYGIEWATNTIYSTAEWYVLPANRQFEYRCQRGAVRVRMQEVLDTATGLWNRKN